jgi:hypothetical protein
MANASKPSILNDRRAIGSEKELDEYGVWLKSESEEFAALEQDRSGEDYFPPFEEKRGPDEGQTSAVVSGGKTAVSGTSGSEASLSAALLLKIAEEIALIKNELAALKSELDRRQNGETSAVPASSVSRPAEAAQDEVAKTGFDAAGTDIAEENAAAETPAQYAADAGEPVADREEAVVEADFDLFDTADGEDLAAGEETKDATEAGTDFFDAAEADDKITLTSGELDLLGEDAGESVAEMDDSFFADDRDEEKIAVSGDEINDILGGVEIPGETDSNAAAKVEEITFEDIPDEPVTESEPETEASVPDEDLPVDDSMFDIDIEPAEEAFSGGPAASEPAAASPEEDGFSIDHIEDIEIEEDAATPDDPGSIAQDLNIEAEGQSFFDDLRALEPAADGPEEDAFSIDHVEREDIEITEDPETPDNLDVPDLNIEAEDQSFFDDLTALEPVADGLEKDVFNSDRAEHIEDIEITEDPETPDASFFDVPAAPEPEPLKEDAFNIEHIEREPAEDAQAEADRLDVPDMPVEPEAETEINFAEDAFDIDDLDNAEAEPEIPAIPEIPADQEILAKQDGAAGLDEDAEEDELAIAEPETADIAFDPFGSLPGEDAADPALTAAEDAPFVDFSVLEDSSSTGMPAEAVTDEAVFDTVDTIDTVETADTLNSIDTADTLDATNTAEPEPAETADDSAAAATGTDPALSRLLDEDFQQTVPAPEDTAYLDEEKLVAFDATEEPEASETPAALSNDDDGGPDTPENIPAEDNSAALRDVPAKFKEELRTVLSYMDILLESLPDEKIEEFARSEHFEPYKKLFKELGLT